MKNYSDETTNSGTYVNFFGFFYKNNNPNPQKIKVNKLIYI